MENIWPGIHAYNAERMNPITAFSSNCSAMKSTKRCGDMLNIQYTLGDALMNIYCVPVCLCMSVLLCVLTPTCTMVWRLKGNL